MKLYNTLTKRIEELKPLKPGQVDMFVCGPTVYDFSHLGHAKTYIQMDVLARTLRASKYRLRYVQNITDIDDKIISRAREKNIDFSELAKEFESYYLEDMKSLNNTSVDEYPRATDYIEQIKSQVQKLIDKGFAYTIENDGIYFEISRFKDYGKLSGRKDIRENDAQSRIDESDSKRGWNDFCLWKFSKADEPTWSAKFGDGRPGWHIEDTAITESIFGAQYDLHGGAIDLIFPHHEAEITQMEASSGLTPFVGMWVHTGFLKVDEAKMSKSLKNFYTIREILKKGYDPRALRLFVLQSNYRSSINFSFENLDKATNRLNSLLRMSELRYQTFPVKENFSPQINSATKNILTNLQNDLNTPEALAEISKIESILMKSGLNSESMPPFYTFLEAIRDLLGIDLFDTEDISQENKELIETRLIARKNNDWAKSDEIRDILLSDGILLQDNQKYTIWHRY